MAKCYLREDSNIYYFKYKDPETGKRKPKSTGETDYDEAELIRKAFLAKLENPPVPYFLDELRLYQKEETNPRRRSALIDGGQYSKSHADTIAYKARQVERIMQERCPEFFKFRLDEFTRRDLKKVTEAIVASLGRCRTAQICQQVVKTVFSEAVQDGVIEVSPAYGQRTIKYEEKARYAVPEDWIASIISRPELFKDNQSWAFFTVAATTGMRRSEILALSKDQIFGNVMTINRAMKGQGRDSEIGLPKWNIIRTIPISEITLNALKTLTPDRKTGRYFYRPSSWAQGIFPSLRTVLQVIDRENEQYWGELTAHILRHSLNTNLLVAGISDAFAAEYLGWKHQSKLLDMQQRYTHFVCKHLQVIPEIIDKLYSFKGSCDCMQI